MSGFFFYLFILFFLLVVMTEPRALCMLGKYSDSELHPQPILFFFLSPFPLSPFFFPFLFFFLLLFLLLQVLLLLPTSPCLLFKGKISVLPRLFCSSLAQMIFQPQPRRHMLLCPALLFFFFKDRRDAAALQSPAYRNFTGFLLDFVLRTQKTCNTGQ